MELQSICKQETLLNKIVKKEKPDVNALFELKYNYAEAKHYFSMLNYSGNMEGDYEILFIVRENNPESGGGTALLSKKGYIGCLKEKFCVLFIYGKEMSAV